MVQVKGVMPPRGGITREYPTGRAVGDFDYGITFDEGFGIVMP